MRFLLFLAALLLLLLGAVLWRLRQPAGPPPSPLEQDPTAGVVTVALAALPAPAAPADAPAAPPAAPTSAGTRPEPSAAAPATEEAAPAAATPRTHTVAAGETLYSIVRAAYGSAPAGLVAAVARANGMADASRIRSGQVLRLPRVPGFPDPR